MFIPCLSLIYLSEFLSHIVIYTGFFVCSIDNLKFHSFCSVSALAVQFRVIIVNKTRKIGMKYENFALYMPKISTTYGTFLLDSRPFS